jgi:ABC-type amino acid transport substrate-binding protein
MSGIACERGVVSRLRILASALACLLLAACQTDNGLVTGSLGSNGSRAIAFESIDGPPPTVFERLVAQLTKEAEARKLPIVSRSNPGAWRVRLYLAAHVQKKQATISWVGDVFDTRYDRAFRVAGEEPVSPARKDVWALADDAVLARIAAKSLDAIMAQMNAPETSPSPAPAEPTGRDTPVADAGTVNSAAFADRRHSFVSE